MPCEMYTAAEEVSMGRVREEKIKVKGDLATRLLCELMRQMEGGDYPAMTQEMQSWWVEHQEEDRQREQKAEEKKLSRELERKRRIKHLKTEIADLEDNEDDEEDDWD